MAYVRVAGRVRVNVAVLTGHGTAGNYSMHARARVYCCGDSSKVYEVPVLTGNSLKHWHAYYAAQVYQALGGSMLNELCKRGIGLRGYNVDTNLEGERRLATRESEAIKDFCNDLHGFLIAERGRQLKRDSLARFSFAIPVLNNEVLENIEKFSVTHNRVDPLQRRRAGEESNSQETGATEMMVFKQEYSSGLYGISASFDLEYLCRPLYESEEGGSACDEEERMRRARASLLALAYLLGGAASKQARALPIAMVEELVVAVCNKPVPNAVHGSYENYVEKTASLLKSVTESLGDGASCILHCYPEGICGGYGSDKLKIKEYRDLGTLLKEAADHASELVGGYGGKEA
ncbi:CRISPR-associated negative autoregulator [Aeropyrum pernix K1]|uniref:CRISPR-associated negative autoregulator n=1 Tax=Aeropyrum pernix (strain ATCC 700893 / DSM 11879 / JCM 9820 / NBRC 100138 / K1) TaxID=272557 RepID=Q9YCM3_AERPE|nr:type I-A CRISPR-associated protein Cas7/Csa2 [Aeropyrum pernix]BAA80224.1 CRISPR-associated negative autoregulator [Aeropyrum pernix K1]